MVVPGFGFSPGDIIAGIQLLDKAVKALQRSGGAETHFQQAAVELSLLADALRAAQRIHRTDENAAIIEKIHASAHACYIPLAKLLEEVDKLKPQLNPKITVGQKLACSGVGENIARGTRKIQWAISLEDKFAQLKARTEPLLCAISILLQTSRLEDADCMH